ncbi:MAG: SDR family NAD(P)-dependent oxidoreductase [Planctomycetota bacterium]
MKSLKNQTAFLTGAASGIGRALAKSLAKEGCHLFLVDRDLSGLTSLEQELAASQVRIHIRQCDLCDKADVSRCIHEALRTTGGIDLLVNNAGVAYYGQTEFMTQTQWDRVMSVNLLAPIQITQELLPAMMGQPDPHIVNMCSVSGLVAGGRFAAYHTSKFGLVGFSEALRAEYGRRGVGVSAICPGPVTTQLYASAEGPHGRQVPVPPAWMCTTPERVAAITIKAILKNRRQVLITPTAHALYFMKRFTPWLIDFVNQFSRKSRVQRHAARIAAARMAQDAATVHSPSDTSRKAA